MAANKFATMLHRNTNKITLILVYTLLEWILIILLLLNSLFSYLIIKFADYFGLKTPCLWCSRLDHLLEPGKNRNSHRDLVCETHANEISKLGYCSNHQKLAESQDMCEDCSSQPDCEEWSKKFAFFPWMKQIGVIQGGDEKVIENGDENLNCSCCGMKLNKFYPPCILIKPSWEVLDYTQKQSLTMEAGVDAQTEEGDHSDQSRSDFIIDQHEDEEAIEENREDNTIFDVNGGCKRRVDEAEEHSACSVCDYGCKEIVANEDDKVDRVIEEQEPIKEVNLNVSMDDQPRDHQTFIQASCDKGLSPEILPQHLEFYIDQDDCRLVLVDLIDSPTTTENQSHKKYKVEDQGNSSYEDVILDFGMCFEAQAKPVVESWRCSEESVTLLSFHESKEEGRASVLDSEDLGENRSSSSVFQGEEGGIAKEENEPVATTQATQTSSHEDDDDDGQSTAAIARDDIDSDVHQAFEDDVYMHNDEIDAEVSIGTEIPDQEPIDEMQLAQEFLHSSYPCAQEDPSTSCANLHACDHHGSNQAEKELLKFKTFSAETGEEAKENHFSLGSEFNEIGEEKVPDTPTSIDSLHQLHKELLLFERREVGTEESTQIDCLSLSAKIPILNPNPEIPPPMDRVTWRTQVLSNHLNQPSMSSPLSPNPCVGFSPPELSEPFEFDTKEMRKLLDAHNLEDRDWLFGLMKQSKLFNPREAGGRVFVSPDYNQSMEQQREMTMKRIAYLLDRGVFEGWLTEKGVEAELRKLALHEVIGIYDHSLAVKLGVHFFLWGGAIQFFGTKRHHDKWLRDTENYTIKGCFAMSELGHGSNVRGIETVTTYDSNTGEFVINTPCESAQKYWIGGAANHATHTIVFSQLNISGKNQGVHAFIAQIRDANGNICPNIRIADCGHKIGLNGVDNGRIWFDNIRIPRENLLNSVADVSPDGQYLSAIKNPDQRFAAFLAPLTSGRVTIAVSAIYSSQISLAIAIRYSLTRRAFSVTPKGPEVLLLDYPSHQQRLLPLLAKTYAMRFAANHLKMIYVKRTPELSKTIHVVSSAFKATLTWHNMRTLQECREACGGQGLKTENRIGPLKGEYDVQSTFEGDNNVLMQQVSKALLAEYIAAQKRSKPFKALGLEHMNKPCPVIPSQLTSSTLQSSQFQMDAFCLRERDLLNRFAMEVSEHQKQGESKEYSVILSYQLAQDLGRAFSDRTILQTLLDAEAGVPSGSLKNVLAMLRSMYALICLEEDPAFLRFGYLSTDNVAAVRKEVSRQCGELRPHALALVSSFGIPDAFLSPIAFNWIDANSWSSVQH